ncbi:class I SAM-dependent methyltransferase [Fuchsiella alkaliacetigena]|uniref:class I SAM-dependent methyltransferase n=1 Tax=Fuchsiella alkaliacetigena TaxID=957042 RepID=UPI00200A0EF5|nr:class I SAM-dependent methyltransferase [Fuchsiella alkaliacetigena]MCK8823623.1 methyltransferase domain-containing protein [Fuchsiella alkaliacetigena]
MPHDFKQAVEFSHELLAEHITSGAKVVDATAGNGYDTEFLAKLVGEQGSVWAFDVQKEAIERTQERLQKAGLAQRVELIKDGHQNLADYISTDLAGLIFNLGYLPGGDKEIITKSESTLKAVSAGVDLLAEGGLLVVVAYLGHAGGKEEYQALLDYLQSLDFRSYNVLNYRFLNQQNEPPQVLAVKRRS